MRSTFLCVLALLSFASCTPKKQPVQEMTAQETFGMLRNDFAILVDVREENEVKQGMAADAQWMPQSKIEANSPEWQTFLGKLSKDKQIVFYCASGNRAGVVAEQLSAKGYKTGNMGGFSDWVKAGYPVKKPE